jgi:Tol biopolymer transport system component
VLVPFTSGVIVYYPSFSPDSDWIAYNRTEAGVTALAPDATLYLVGADGGDPIPLARANRSEPNAASWPRWGPIPDDDVLWLAFASDRPYGHSDPEGAWIWVSGIDTTLAEQGLDPSLPAWWMPQQDIGTSNHAPWWATD